MILNKINVVSIFNKFKDNLRCVNILIIMFLIVFVTIDYTRISWIATAIGRIILIKTLPLWDWTYLYNEKCLIKSFRSSKSDKILNNEYASEKLNCVLCQDLDKIDVIGNTTFQVIKENYLHKGIPLIIIDSSQSIKLENFIENIINSKNFLEHNPCDVETNLILPRYLNLKYILDDILNYTENNSWFLQMRNCNSAAVKASRNFIEKPYFYSQHLEPFYSSWIIMSDNYRNYERHLNLYGLIILQQKIGDIIVILTPKEFCLNICEQQEILIKQGESLIFSTDLWTFTYVIDNYQTILTTISETIL